MNNSSTVLILGAGVHGAAIALNLVLQGVPVHVVDPFDIAYGATSKSSRLIHGGLRYLEYGDFRLVRESLAAREQNLLLAPQFVRPLRFHIPTSQRWTGLLRSASGFLGLNRTSFGQILSTKSAGRGYWPVSIGLWMYSRLSGASAIDPLGAPGTPRVNSKRYQWLCSYTDAQMQYPERLVVALLADAQRVAKARGVPFQVSTHARLEYHPGEWRICDTLQTSSGQTNRITSIQPAYIVNATGAWGDFTLKQLQVESPPLFGGTKGTHFLTWNERLVAALQGQAVYAEAEDGRLVFILPFGDGVLVGTTDETFSSQPETATATEAELDYLLQLVNEVMDCQLSRDDITLHYSGIRPLPKSALGTNAAVSRDHALNEQFVGNCPVLTLIGGKLTTWREFGREVSDRVLDTLRIARRDDHRFRPVLGAEPPADQTPRPFPVTEEHRKEIWTELSRQGNVSVELISALWPLYGWQVAEILPACQHDPGTPIFGTPFTSGIVRWVIEHEWVRTLSDLVERRLMLVLAKNLTRQTLIDLADCLVQAGKLSADDVPNSLATTAAHLLQFYGRKLS